MIKLGPDLTIATFSPAAPSAIQIQFYKLRHLLAPLILNLRFPCPHLLPHNYKYTLRDRSLSEIPMPSFIPVFLSMTERLLQGPDDVFCLNHLLCSRDPAYYPYSLSLCFHIAKPSLEVFYLPAYQVCQ